LRSVPDGGDGLGDGENVDDLAASTLGELHRTVNEREQAVIAGATHVLAWVHLGATLTNDDGPCGDLGAVEDLDMVQPFAMLVILTTL
jgi:hypothetical protein